MSDHEKDWLAIIDRYAPIVGGVSIVLCVLLGVWPSMHGGFFNAWMFGWFFWLGVSLGGMAFSMMHHLTGGGWGALIRPITLSAARVLPLMFILFLPIFLGLRVMFPWARPQELAADPVILHLHTYMNPGLFALRFVLYFAIWIGLTWGLAHVTDAGMLRRISAGGLVIYSVLISLAGADWIMSREPHWVSSVFGFILIVSESLTALCFAVVVLRFRVRRPEVAAFARPNHFIDLGNLLLMMVILWAYMNFAQYLITWTGNEQPDIGWYVQRTYGGWRVVAGIIIFVHFLIPLFLLLMRPLKEDIGRLAAICGALLFLRILDIYWLIGPQQQSDPHGGFILSPMDILAWIGIGGVWWTVFSYYLKRAPLLATVNASGKAVCD
jgi:hypothetical protein